jgi:undecaprenyl-phosphate galactose phosphotransferase
MSNTSSVVGESPKEFAINALLRQRRHLLTVATLILTDLIVFTLAARLFRSSHNVPQLLVLPDPPLFGSPIDLYFSLALIFIVVRYICGDYNRRCLFWDRTRATTLSLLFAAMPCLFIVMVLPTHYSASAEVETWIFLLFAIPMFRHGARLLLDRFGMWRLPTALIASAARYKDVFDTLNTTLSLGCRINWLAFEGEMPTLDRSEMSDVHTFPIGNQRELVNRLIAEGCDLAVVATDDMHSENFAELIQRLMEAGIAVSFIPSFSRLPLAGMTTSYFFGKDILLFQMRSSLQSRPSRFVKRTFDIIGSLAALILLSPLFAAVAIAIKRYDGGPMTYSQIRTGRNGEQFRCFKFRTMAVDADQRLERWRHENPELYAEFQKTFKLVNDPRVTKPGAWLRKTSLDELPQLMNVLFGEMSLVGPRPVLEQELIEFYGPAATLYKRIRPGLTGLWQVRGRSDTSYEQRVVFDEWYILNWSFWYDIVILLQTVWVVFRRKGAY